MKQRILMRSEYDFFNTASTRWRDMDGLGHINHTVYLGLLETKHKEFIDHIHGDNNDHEFGLQSTEAGLLASMKVLYIKQVRHPAELDIGYRITRVGSKSYDVHQAIFLKGDDEPAFQSIHTFVMFNFVEQKSIPVGDLIKNNLKEVK
jgi:acyl-CoA thioester hydrolase